MARPTKEEQRRHEMLEDACANLANVGDLLEVITLRLSKTIKLTGQSDLLKPIFEHAQEAEQGIDRAHAIISELRKDKTL